MSEQQEIVSPTESASNVGRKKFRPGKAQRAAARSDVTGQASSVTGPSSLAPAAMFARKMSFQPTPQPGRYPIVFPSGAGEPTRDSHFSIDPDSISRSFSGLGAEYVNSARYAEFSSHAEYDDLEFHKDVTISAILALAQQIVHAHQNIGLPIGDFSSISSTDVYTMSGVRAIVRQFGEFSVENLGTRYLLHSYEDEVRALVRTAKRIKDATDVSFIASLIKELWLPTKVSDSRTKFIVASRFRKYLEGHNVSISMTELLNSVFTQASPVYNVVKGVLPATDQGLFDWLFTSYDSASAFTDLVNSNGARATLRDKLGLTFSGTSLTTGHLNWSLVPKTKFPELAEPWLRKRATITKFFSCGSGLVEKSEAIGSANQISTVDINNGVTVVRTQTAVSAGDYSLMACFPPSVVYPSVSDLNVVVTTSIPVRTRATEFLQKDWL